MQKIKSQCLQMLEGEVHNDSLVATPRSDRSAALLETQTRPSSRNSVNAGQRLSMYWIALARSCPRASLTTSALR